MPIKQSTDIRYNAPKHLEERYNITKVSEASAYQYPDGALHYFTEDCTGYPKGLYKYDGTKWEQFDLGGGESGCIVKYTTVKAAVDSGEDFKEGSLLFNLAECTVGDVTYHYRSWYMYDASKEWFPIAPSVDYFTTLNFVYQFMMEGEVGERTIKTFTIEDLLGEEDSTKTVDELIAEGKLDADGNILNMPSFIDARTIIPRYTTLLEYWRDAAIYWEYFDGVFTSRRERKRFILGTDQLILGSSTCYQTDNGIRIKALTIKGNEDTNKVSCLPMQNRTPEFFNIQIAPRNNSGLGFANDRQIIRDSLGNEMLALLPGNNRYNTGSLVEEVTDIEGALDCDIPSVGAIRKLIDGGSITPGEGGGNSGGSGEGGGNTPPAGVKVEETEDAFILKGETPSDSQYYSKTEIDQKFEEFEPGSGEVSWDNITDKPTIPDEQVNADWNATSGKAQILNKPQFKSVGGYPILGEGNIPNEPNMHLIKQLTVESVCRGVQIDTDNDGNSFNLSQVIVFVNLIPGTDTSSRKFTIDCNGANGCGWAGVGLGNDACGGTNKRFMSWWRVLGDRIMPVVSWASFNSTSMSNELTPVAKAADGCFYWGNRIRGQYHITSVQVGSGLYDHIGIGTEIEIYGC